MNNTGEIKARMKSIRQTVQIANAQKLIAASRIGKAQKMLADSKPYHDNIRQTIAELLALHPEVLTPFVGDNWKTSLRPGFLVLSSDTGLAGGYNSNLVKFSEQELTANAYKPVTVLVQGHLGRDALLRKGLPVDTTKQWRVSVPSMRDAGEISKFILSLFENHTIDGFGIIYTKYYSAAKLEPVREKLFPLPPESFGDAGIIHSDVSFEPSPEAVMEMLIPKYIKGFIYGCLIHSWTSELASRVTAMDNAIRNGREMLDKLNLAYNRARQAAITQEITEIVAGANALAE
jgi:F-type H+-transporting ATPase subunit gamma